MFGKGSHSLLRHFFFREGLELLEFFGGLAGVDCFACPGCGFAEVFGVTGNDQGGCGVCQDYVEARPAGAFEEFADQGSVFLGRAAGQGFERRGG